MKIMTKICATIASLLIAGLANAATPGIYIGAGIGGTMLDIPDVTDLSDAYVSISEERKGFGGRLFAGYNFNKYIGLETAYAIYANATIKASAQDLGVSISDTYSLSALSLVGKGYLPFGESGFNVYVLGGMAEVMGKERFKASGLGASISDSQTTYKLRPTYGAGVSYDFTDHVTTNLEVSRIQGKGDMKTNTSAIPNADMVSLNLSYNFG
jgi:opacity protein-like surface antigen